MLALQHRFGIPFLMAGSVQVAARLCESILMRWSLKDNLGVGFNGLKVAQQIMREMKEIYPGLFAYMEGVKEALESSPEGKRYVRSIRDGGERSTIPVN